MAEARKKYPKLTTPRGRFKYPKIHEVDYGSKEYPKPDGEYSVQLVMQQDVADAFLDRPFKFDGGMTTLREVYAQAEVVAREEFGKLKVESRKKLGEYKMNDLYTVLYDQETEEPTGEVQFKFSMKAGGTLKKGPKTGQKWSRKPDVYDARGVPLKKVPEIWGGTVGKVSCEASPYFIPGTGIGGLKLNLLGVQIIDLVAGGTRTASSHGFGEEDGYAHSEDEETIEENSEDSSDETTDEENVDF